MTDIEVPEIEPLAVGTVPNVASDQPIASSWGNTVADDVNYLLGVAGPAAAAWTPFTPTVKFGATVASIASDCRWVRLGRLIVAEYGFRFTNLNGGTGNMSMTRPVPGRVRDASVRQTYGLTAGVATLFDLSSGGPYKLTFGGNSTDQSDLACHTIAQPGITVTQTIPLAIAVGALGTGDELWGTAIYEAAT